MAVSQSVRDQAARAAKRPRQNVFPGQDTCVRQSNVYICLYFNIIDHVSTEPRKEDKDNRHKKKTMTNIKTKKKTPS